MRDEVSDCKLGTLARHFRLSTRPTHRAFDDAMATTELLHLLLERAAGLGVTGLADALLMLGLRYGNDEAAAQTEAWLKAIARAAYLASVDLAKEKEKVIAPFQNRRWDGDFLTLKKICASKT